MTSKERSDLRSQANTIETTLIVGKSGISESVIAEAEKLLDDHELVKGKVLEASLLSAREACDALCAETGAEGVQVVGSKFVLYRKSEKKEKQPAAKAPKAAKPAPKKSGKDNPVKKGVKARKELHKKQQQQKDEYFHQAAVKAAIERRKQRESGEQ